jgi:hypothetical protein
METPMVNTIFTLRSCSPIAGATVIEFNTEEELLDAWQVKACFTLTSNSALTKHRIWLNKLILTFLLGIFFHSVCPCHDGLSSSDTILSISTFRIY